MTYKVVEGFMSLSQAIPEPLRTTAHGFACALTFLFCTDEPQQNEVDPLNYK